MTKRPSNGMLANLWTVPLIPIADLDLDDDYQPEELVTAVENYFKREYQLQLTAHYLTGRLRPIRLRIRSGPFKV